MTKSTTKTTRISAVFLAAVLIAGTFALVSPSLMGGAQAEPYSYGGMDSKYKKYSYGHDYDKKPKYPKYPPHKPDFSKDKDSVSIKKIKCNNINVNVNDFSLNVGSDNTGTGGGAGSSGVAASGLSPQSLTRDGTHDGFKKFDKDFVFVCINNNNNEGRDGGDKDDGGKELPPGCECFEQPQFPQGAFNQLERYLQDNPQAIGTVTGIDTVEKLCLALQSEKPVDTDFIVALFQAAQPGQGGDELPEPWERLLECLFRAGYLDEDPGPFPS